MRIVDGHLVIGIDAAIDAEAPALAAAGPRDRAEMVRAVLAGLAGRRPPTAAELDAERGYGLRCAGDGIPVESVVAAYHIGFRQIWEKLVECARARHPDGVPDLLDLFGLLWSWLPKFAEVAAEGYDRVAQERRAGEVRATAEFVDVLSGARADSDRGRVLSHALGLDPDGDYQVVCATAPEPGVPAGALDERLRAVPGPVRWLSRRGRITVISQGVPVDALLRAFTGGPGSAYGKEVGVGLRRAGLTGAAAGLTGAASALDLAVVLARPVFFETDWLWITMLRHLDRLRPLLGAGRPADLPQLGDAARAYGDGGWSIAGAAANLGLHPNTVRYRLDRLGQVAQLDPRTMAGQRLSVLQDIVFLVDAAKCGR